MRTVITHFFNEEYLLPWWLNHHVKLFDYGLLIDHGSTDNSLDICRQMAPNWRLVRTRLKHFDAQLNDFEVMMYELEIDGWKIVLNTTEFLVANPSLERIERFLRSEKLIGIAGTGMTMIDKQPGDKLTADVPLVQQKPWAVDDNRFTKYGFFTRRLLHRYFGYPLTPLRNRFYHALPNGMYHVGRHLSAHPDFRRRLPNLMILHYAYAPWTESLIRRKMQIGAKIPEADKVRGLGRHHLRTAQELQEDFDIVNRLPFIDLRQHDIGTTAIGMLGQNSDASICVVPNRR